MANTPFDNRDHERTYRGFIGMVKWGTPLSIIMFLIVILFTT